MGRDFQIEEKNMVEEAVLADPRVVRQVRIDLAIGAMVIVAIVLGIIFVLWLAT